MMETYNIYKHSRILLINEVIPWYVQAVIKNGSKYEQNVFDVN